MDTSILTSIKKLLGITEEYTVFDVDVIMYINSVISILTQLGVGPSSGYSLVTGDETWEDYLGTANVTTTNLEIVKAYIAQKVRLLFDPPVSGPAKEALERLTAELEWRINVMVDPVGMFVENKN